MTDSINEWSESSQFPVTITVCIYVNIYYGKPYISLCYSFLALEDHNIYGALFLKEVLPLYKCCCRFILHLTNREDVNRITHTHTHVHIYISFYVCLSIYCRRDVPAALWLKGWIADWSKQVRTSVELLSPFSD